ncbi:hypothetical protein OPV22_028657 [Ensete ventricosum]|uniref:Uncharacterized protein n=1 Tax=Ensete ventricosum TaxID=4639 RepID=A0AAV8Q3D1_ENSVE|nr:hypothetical protein OPV22_028657 [Ensete ventricosum]
MIICCVAHRSSWDITPAGGGRSSNTASQLVDDHHDARRWTRCGIRLCCLLQTYPLVLLLLLRHFFGIIATDHTRGKGFGSRCDFTQRRMITRFQLRVGTSLFISSVVLLVVTTYLFLLILKKLYVLAMVPLLLLLVITLVVLLRGGTLQDEIHGDDDPALSQARELKLLNLSSYVTTITSGGIITTVIAYMKNFSSSAYHYLLESSTVLLFISNIVGFFAMLLLLFTSMISYSADRRERLIAIASFFTYASFVLLTLLTLMVASESLALPHVLFTTLFAVGGVLYYSIRRTGTDTQENEVTQLEDTWKNVGTFAFSLMMVVRLLHLGSEAFAIKSFMFLCASAFQCIQSQMLVAVLTPVGRGRLSIKIIFCLVGLLLVAAILNVFFI